MSRLVLVGLPGVGKTSLARALAERWSCEALDTDDMVAHEVGTPVAQYLRDEGEAAFRTRELEALRIALDRSSDVVIATGGGIVCTSEARAALRDELTLWLDCDDDTILARVGEVDRPLLNGNPATLARLREERGEWYRSVSQSRVDTSGPLDEVVTEVARQVERLTP